MENILEKRSEKEPIMTIEQKEFLARMTCAMVEYCDDLEQEVEESDVPQEYKNKIKKAIDMINAVNQKCHDKE